MIPTTAAPVVTRVMPVPPVKTAPVSRAAKVTAALPTTLLPAAHQALSAAALPMTAVLPNFYAFMDVALLHSLFRRLGLSGPSSRWVRNAQARSGSWGSCWPESSSGYLKHGRVSAKRKTCCKTLPLCSGDVPQIP